MIWADDGCASRLTAVAQSAITGQATVRRGTGHNATETLDGGTDVGVAGEMRPFPIQLQERIHHGVVTV